MISAEKEQIMHEYFGEKEGQCKDCSNFRSYRYRDTSYRKCIVYGDTRSQASDWRGKAKACGMFNKEYRGISIIHVKKNSSVKETQIEGQLSLL